jgi:hypothetical protein
MNVTRRDLALGAGAAATGSVTTILSSLTADADSNKGSLIPDFKKMSPPVYNKLVELLLRASLNPVRAGSDDPDYSEFWLQMVPKDSSVYEEANYPTRSKLESYVANLRQNHSLVSDGDFSEDAFTEISPDFGEMCDPNGCGSGGSKTKNSKITIKARLGGKKIGDAQFYSDIIKTFAK